MFGKRLTELTLQDIERVIAEELQEGTELEFKAGLPAKGKESDPWMSGKDTVSDYARNRLVEEIIAFANAHGGILLLGVQESGDKPSRAAGLVPIRNCAELADRLKLQCRNCIESQLPLLEIVGVPTTEDGSGVVVIAVRPSRMAPHRHMTTKECHVRRQDRCERMSMREIQDLTLQVERGLAHIEQEFGRRSTDFARQFGDYYNQHQRAAYAMRVTGIPTAPIYIDRVFNNPAVTPPLTAFKATSPNGGTVELYMPHYSARTRPIIRGAQWDSGDPGSLGRREVNCDGLIEYRFFEHPPENERMIFPGWIMSIVANAMCAIEKFRVAADAPATEYAMDISLLVWGGDFPIARYGGGVRQSLGPLRGDDYLMPRYSVGPREEFPRLTSLFERDFWNAAGHDFNDPLDVDFSQIERM